LTGTALLNPIILPPFLHSFSLEKQYNFFGINIVGIKYDLGILASLSTTKEEEWPDLRQF
jgi:hypothetical protein